jgi:hypothetical protein
MSQMSRAIVMFTIASLLISSSGAAQNTAQSTRISLGKHPLDSAAVRSQQPPATITREWVGATYLELRPILDTGRSAAPRAPFESVRKRPEVTAALLSFAQDSSSPGLSRNNAILLLGRTGQDRAYQFLARAFDTMPPGARLRLNVILAMGNGYPDRPPDYIYVRLQQALTKAPPEEREMAAMALGDIQSPKALNILRARLPLEPSPTIQRRIMRGLNKVQK